MNKSSGALLVHSHIRATDSADNQGFKHLFTLKLVVPFHLHNARGALGSWMDVAAVNCSERHPERLCFTVHWIPHLCLDFSKHSFFMICLVYFKWLKGSRPCYCHNHNASIMEQVTIKNKEEMKYQRDKKCKSNKLNTIDKIKQKIR